MGRIVLQMMMSVDGMVSGPNGEVDWIAQDEPLNRAHLEILKQSKVAVVGAGSYPAMGEYWTATEHDDKATPVMREVGAAMNVIPKIIYSHHDMPLTWRNTSIHVVADDQALVKDVQRLKRETHGTIMVYGGVHLARTFLKHDLPDELHLVICPVILGAGQSLFTELTHRANLRLHKSLTHASGATQMLYEVVRSG